MTVRDLHILELGNVLFLRWEMFPQVRGFLCQIHVEYLHCHSLECLLNCNECRIRNVITLSAASQHGALPAGHGQHYDQKSSPSAGWNQQRCLLPRAQWWQLSCHLHHNRHTSDLSCWDSPGPKLPDDPLHCPIRGTHRCQRAKETKAKRSLYVYSRQWQSAYYWYVSWTYDQNNRIDEPLKKTVTLSWQCVCSADIYIFS